MTVFDKAWSIAKKSDEEPHPDDKRGTTQEELDEQDRVLEEGGIDPGHLIDERFEEPVGEGAFYVDDVRYLVENEEWEVMPAVQAVAREVGVSGRHLMLAYIKAYGKR